MGLRHKSLDGGRERLCPLQHKSAQEEAPPGLAPFVYLLEGGEGNYLE